MPLPQATDREPLHERSISYRGYLRADGRWDIDAWLRDVKAYDREVDGRLLSAGTPVHDMGRIVQAGRRAAFAEADLRGLDGRLYATATSTCLVMER